MKIKYTNQTLSEKMQDMFARAKNRIDYGLISAGTLLASTLPTALAAPTGTSDNITTSITGGVGNLYGIIKSIVLPIAALVFAFNAFKALFGGEKGMESAKRNMLIIVVIIALVLLAPMIIQTVSGWFTTSVDISTLKPS